MPDAKYLFEKDTGRRSPTGDLLLVKLSPKHKAICARFMRGEKPQDIAEQLEMDFQAIYRILRDPLAREYMESKLCDLDDEIRDRFQAALKVVDDALAGNGEDNPVALKAADMILKAGGAYDSKLPPGATAEDVVAALVAKLQQTVTVNVNVPGSEATKATLDQGGQLPAERSE